MKNAKNILIFVVCLAVSLILPRIPYGYYLSYVGIVAAAALLGVNMGIAVGLFVGLAYGFGIANGAFAQYGMSIVNTANIFRSLVPYMAVAVTAGVCCKKGLNEKSLVKCIIGVFAASVLGSLVGSSLGWALLGESGALQEITARMASPYFWIDNAVNTVLSAVITYAVVKVLPKDFTDNAKKSDGIEDIDYMKL